MSNLALDTLIKKRQQLEDERSSVLQKYSEQIVELDSAIIAINGGRMPDMLSKTGYDDESPTYITGAEDGI